MSNCPLCHQNGISLLRKLFLGDALPAKCKYCCEKVVMGRITVKEAIFPLMPALIGAWIALMEMSSFSSFFKMNVIGVSVLISFVMLVKKVPLVPASNLKGKK